MKKLLCFSVSLLSLGFMLFAKPFTPAAPEAVVSIYANDKIGWYGEADSEGGKGLLNLAARAAVNKNADDEAKARLGYTGYLLEDAKADLFEALANAGIEVIDEATVFNSAAFANAEDNKMKKAAFYVTPEGYKLFGNKDKQFAPIASELGAAGLISVFIDCEKMMDSGVAKNGKMKACCSVTIEFIDTNGKTLKLLNGFATANEKIAIAGGVYDVDKVAAQFPEVIKAAYADALSKMNK